ncbi:hypothetical protein LJR267_009282 [Paraburkholderia hospita]
MFGRFVQNWPGRRFGAAPLFKIEDVLSVPDIVPQAQQKPGGVFSKCWITRYRRSALQLTPITPGAHPGLKPLAASMERTVRVM